MNVRRARYATRATAGATASEEVRPLPVAADVSPAGDVPTTGSRGAEIAWFLVALATTGVGALLPLLFSPRYYFINDTEAGAFPQWFAIGERLVNGDWSLLNPTVWQSGNYQAEGAWGVYSPFLWMIGIGAYIATDAVFYATVVKIVCLLLASGGMYFLARTIQVTRPWAALAGAAAPLAGFTMYFDATAWANGLMAWCMWPIAYALARRSALQGRSAVLALVPALTLVGIGYVSATLFLAATFLALIFEASLTRRRTAVLRALALSAVAGLFAVVVHLPGLLTAPVSGRQNRGVANDGFLGLDVSDLLQGAIASGGPQVDIYEGAFINAPITYIAWFLPLVAFVDLRRWWGLLRTRLPLLLLFGVAVASALAPSQVGPLRYPVRVIPFLAVIVLLLVVLGLSRARRADLRVRHLLLAQGLLAASGYAMLAQNPDAWRPVLGAGVLTAGLVVVAFLALGGRMTRTVGPLVPPAARSVAAALVALAGLLVLLVPQHAVAPKAPLYSYQLPREVAAYQGQLAGAVGDTLVVGTPRRGDYSEALIGNAWYVNPYPVANAYSSVYYPGYSSRLCMDFKGTTCADLYQRLFERLPDSGERLVDVLGASTLVVIVASSSEEESGAIQRRDLDPVPEGWSVLEDTGNTRTLVRDEPVDGAGGVAWTSEGTSAALVARGAMSTSFRVDDVPAGGGEVALRLIPWPGYQVEGARLADEPTDDLALTVEVPESARGEVVTVTFWSPGWQVQAAAGALALLLLVLLAIDGLRRGRGSARPRPVTASSAAARE